MSCDLGSTKWQGSARVRDIETGTEERKGVRNEQK